MAITGPLIFFPPSPQKKYLELWLQDLGYMPSEYTVGFCIQHPWNQPTRGQQEHCLLWIFRTGSQVAQAGLKL